MNDKPTYEELENKIAELKKQNEAILLNSAFQNQEKEKRPADLIAVNDEFTLSNQTVLFNA